MRNNGTQQTRRGAQWRRVACALSSFLLRGGGNWRLWHIRNYNVNEARQ
jgi:hypothetical protein